MVDTREELKEYKDRLLGLVPTERITRFKIDRPEASVIAGYRDLVDATPTLSDILDSMGINGAISGSVLAPVIEGKTVAGPAVTLRCSFKRVTPTQWFEAKEPIGTVEVDAYNLAEPGDVVVMDANGAEISCMGGMSASFARTRKLSACVVYGGVRDLATIRKLQYPVWSAHVTPKTGKYRLDPMEINGPVTIAGIQVRPGDLVVADDTGVVIVPLERAEEVLRLAQKVIATEGRLVAALANGASMSELRRLGSDLPHM